MIKRILLLSLALAASTAVQADELDKVKQRVSEHLTKVNPTLRIDSVAPTPVAGLYEVTIGTQIVYVSADGRYLLQGDLVDLQEQRSLTEARRQAQRLPLLEAVPDEEYIVYPAKGENKHRVIVVTDIDCPYCRRMHAHMDEINGLGIELRYLQMPRAGVQSPSFRKAVSVYCAEDSTGAMDKAKAGQSVAEASCENPVARHMQLASRLGINATPTVVFANGSVHPGYMTAEQLLKRAEEESAR
jgi:thiol:disulfide interchange protein DsbC